MPLIQLKYNLNAHLMNLSKNALTVRTYLLRECFKLILSTSKYIKWNSRFPDGGMDGSMDPMIYGSIDLWIYGFMDRWIYRSMDLYIYGSNNLWTYESTNLWNTAIHQCDAQAWVVVTSSIINTGLWFNSTLATVYIQRHWQLAP
jgi:hypothetical protein